MEQVVTKYGWVCIRCGKAYSPEVKECDCSLPKLSKEHGTTAPVGSKVYFGGTVIEIEE